MTRVGRDLIDLTRQLTWARGCCCDCDCAGDKKMMTHNDAYFIL